MAQGTPFLIRHRAAVTIIGTLLASAAVVLGMVAEASRGDHDDASAAAEVAPDRIAEAAPADVVPPAAPEVNGTWPPTEAVAPPVTSWWVANSEFSDCHGSGGPAQQLDGYVGHTDQPTTKDYRDGNGNLEKVEVIVPQPYGMESVVTFYRDKAKCLAEQVNRTRDLADQYRN